MKRRFAEEPQAEVNVPSRRSPADRRRHASGRGEAGQQGSESDEENMGAVTGIVSRQCIGHDLRQVTQRSVGSQNVYQGPRGLSLWRRRVPISGRLQQRTKTQSNFGGKSSCGTSWRFGRTPRDGSTCAATRWATASGLQDTVTIFARVTWRHHSRRSNSSRQHKQRSLSQRREQRVKAKQLADRLRAKAARGDTRRQRQPELKVWTVHLLWVPVAAGLPQEPGVSPPTHLRPLFRDHSFDACTRYTR